MAENEVIELDFDEILTLIQGQLYEYMNAPENNGKYNGYGKLFFTDGSWFEGIFVDNNPYKGMRFFVDGKISEYQEGKQL